MSLVFLVHFHAIFGGYFPEGSASRALSVFFSNAGRAGTDFFLALSGFFLYRNLMRQPQACSAFIRRRALRILPPFYVVLGLYLLMSWYVPEESRIPEGLADGVLYVAWNALLLAGVLPIQPLITVTWSLSYIFAFYLVLPVFLRLTGMRRLGGGKRVLVLLATTAALVGAKAAGARFNTRVLMFLAGMLAFEALASVRLTRLIGRRSEIVSVALLVSSFPAGHLLARYLEVGVELQTLPLEHQLLRLGTLGLIAILIGLHVFREDTILSKALALWPLPRLGEISYSFYLVHGLTLKTLGLVLAADLVARPQPPLLVWTLLPLSFLTAVLVAWLFFALVERHWIRSPSRVAQSA